MVSSQFSVPHRIEFCLSPLFRNLKNARYKSVRQTLEGILRKYIEEAYRGKEAHRGKHTEGRKHIEGRKVEVE